MEGDRPRFTTGRSPTLSIGQSACLIFFFLIFTACNQGNREGLLSKAGTRTTRVEQRPVVQQNSSSICSLVGTSSPRLLWNRHLDYILNVSLPPRVDLYEPYRQALRLVSAHLDTIQRAPITDSNQQQLQRVLEKLERRYDYLMHKREGEAQRQEPPPVSITVLGGSVAAGTMSQVLPNLDTKHCRWSAIIERMFGKDLVTVHNVAVGGTNSRFGAHLLEYDLLQPDEALEPDIIIAAYLVNDMRYNTKHDFPKQLDNDTGLNTPAEYVLWQQQTLLRAALRKCSTSSSSPPLIVLLDDYLGNAQTEIFETTTGSRVQQVLANYYSVGLASYADAVRRTVYANLDASHYNPLVPTAWKDNKWDLHPGPIMHATTAFSLAYYFLQQVTRACQQQQEKQGPVPKKNDEINYSDMLLQPNLKPIPAVLPPLLTPTLGLDTVTQKWEQQDTSTCHQRPRVPGNNKIRRVCPFSWLSGVHRPSLSGPHTKERIVEDIEAVFRPYINDNLTDWFIGDDTRRGRYGFKPRHANTTTSKVDSDLLLDFSSLVATTTINSITIIYVKSYGPRWEQSMVNVSVFDNERRDLASVVLNGHHESKTSELYEEKIAFRSNGSNGLQLHLRHSNRRKTFKVMGIFICTQ